jgi:DNA-binding transcriptional LysR family regulator
MATFVRVVDAQSLSAAARALRLSLPAVSRQLSALEAELGATLIVRSTRKLHVTDAGREWYQRCVRVLGEVEEARDAVRGTKSVRGRLVVSASLTFGLVVVVPRLDRLANQYPQLVVDLRLEDRLVDLVGEGVDLALRAGLPPPDSTGYVAHPIASMRRILVAAPRWLRNHGVPREPRELAKHDCLVQVTPAGNVVRWSLHRQDAAETVEVRGRTRTNAPIALRELAVRGAGIAYLPDWLVSDELARGTLKRVLPEWASTSIPAWAIYRAELRGAPRVRAFLDALAMPGVSGARKGTRRPRSSAQK